MRHSGSPYAFAALIVGNIMLAFGPWLVRLSQFGPMASAFWRVSLALPILIAISITTRQMRRFDHRIIGALFIGGVFFALDLAAWHRGILQTRLANATLFGNVTSFFFAIYGFLITRSLPGRNQALAMLLAGAGVILLLGRSYELSPRNFGGDLLCILAGLFYTGYLIAISRTGGGVQPWAALTLSTLASVPTLFVAVLMTGQPLFQGNWGPLIALALGSQVIGQGLIVFAVGRLSPVVVGVTLLTQPIIATLIGWVRYGERLGIEDFAGALAIAAAIILVRLPDRRRMANG